ncbi:unnamed protein product [Rhizophagus irregularis]|nr:unnamed protein product [Rhizophagus irregularis]CAB5296468.1 unnamed protein product [Rhizophagus irregularis]
MKASTLQLPTLDILNKNYPDILKGLKTCFLSILTEHAEIPTCIWQDSIRFCKIFSWTRSASDNIAQNEHLLIFFTQLYTK